MQYASDAQAVRQADRRVPGDLTSSSPTWRRRSRPGKHLMFHAAWLAQHGKPFSKEAAMAKLFCSELAMRATIKAVQVHGGYGYTKDYPVERMMRDAKICEIGEGTSEIQRMVIARHILKELAGLSGALRCRAPASISYSAVIPTFALPHPVARGDSRASRIDIARQHGRGSRRPCQRARRFRRAFPTGLGRSHASPVIGGRPRPRRCVHGTPRGVGDGDGTPGWGVVDHAARPAPLPVPDRRRAVSARTRGAPGPSILCPTAPQRPSRRAAPACAVPDETRDPDQCDPARDARRHPRGRPAR